MKEAGIDVFAIITSAPSRTIEDEFAEARVVYLDYYYNSDRDKDASIKKLLRELNKKLLEALDEKRVEEQKIH